MKIIIENDKYNLPYGIGLLKTLYGDDYNNLPNDFQHEELKKIWKNYQGIPEKLYKMTQSEDSEILELALKLLEERKIKCYKKFHNVYNEEWIEKLHKLKIFLTMQEELWNNYK